MRATARSRWPAPSCPAPSRPVGRCGQRLRSRSTSRLACARLRGSAAARRTDASARTPCGVRRNSFNLASRPAMVSLPDTEPLPASAPTPVDDARDPGPLTHHRHGIPLPPASPTSSRRAHPVRARVPPGFPLPVWPTVRRRRGTRVPATVGAASRSREQRPLREPPRPRDDTGPEQSGRHRRRPRRQFTPPLQSGEPHPGGEEHSCHSYTSMPEHAVPLPHAPHRTQGSDRRSPPGPFSWPFPRTIFLVVRPGAVCPSRRRARAAGSVSCRDPL